MRVVFMGTPEFAVPSLEALATAHDVVAVYTAPDRVRGRGNRATPSPVKSTAEALGLTVVQPTTMRDPAVLGELKSLGPDAICVAAYGLILPRQVLELPAYGCLNVHASLLPRHRGAAPIHRAILDGDEYTGVVTMRMEEGLDTGPYTNAASVAVADRTVDELSAILAREGAQSLLLTLREIEDGTVVWIDQDEHKATYAAKVTDADLALTPDLTVEAALRRVRASSKSAKARLCIAGQTLDVLRARPAVSDLGPGRISCTGRAVLVGFSDGVLELLRVKPEGRAEMDGVAYGCGARVPADSRWEGIS